MIYLLAGYMWLFIHRPFEIWPILAAVRLERIYMIITIVWWLFASRKTLLANRLNAAFLMFGVAICAASVLSPYGEFLNLTVENWLKSQCSICW